METRWALALAGAAGVALYVIHRSTATPSAPAVPQSIPPKAGSGSSVGGLVQKIGNLGGTFVGGAAGLGPVAPVIGQGAGSFIAEEYGAWSQAGGGLVKIGSGDVLEGGKDVVVGGVRTATAPVVSAYNTVKGWF